MAKIDHIRPQILDHLQALPPLTVVKLTDLYELPFVPKGKDHSVRIALYGLCAGTPVSERNPPKKLYGIRLNLSVEKQVILSLPGIPREYLKQDHKRDTTIERIVRRLKKKYGAATIDFWAKAAQKRSVDQAAAGMREAKSRDQHFCLLCKAEGTTDARRVTACHIISRRASFWLALDEVDKTKGAIFTDEATRLLSRKLKKHDVHSASQYIVTLCKDHNSLLLEALTQCITRESKMKLQEQAALFPEHPLPLTSVVLEKVVEIGGEGGSIVLYGSRRREGAWMFKLGTDESGLTEILGEAPSSCTSFKGWARTWSGALRLLSRYPWKRLYPLYVHPDFTELVAKEIMKKGLQSFERDCWNAVLFSKCKDMGMRADVQLYAKKAALLERAMAVAEIMDEEQGL